MALALPVDLRDRLASYGIDPETTIDDLLDLLEEFELGYSMDGAPWRPEPSFKAGVYRRAPIGQTLPLWCEGRSPKEALVRSLLRVLDEIEAEHARTPHQW